MSPYLLTELADLFTAEAFDSDLRLDSEEADRFWDIADELRMSAALLEAP